MYQTNDNTVPNDLSPVIHTLSMRVNDSFTSGHFFE